jgi:hypothetical protein
MDWVGGQHCVEMRTYRWGSESRGSWIDEVDGRRTKEGADGWAGKTGSKNEK